MTKELPWYIAIGETILAILSLIRTITAGPTVFIAVSWIIIAIIFAWSWALANRTIQIWKELFFNKQKEDANEPA